MFDSLKEKIGLKVKGEIVTAPMEGKVIALSKVSDPTFSQEMLGKGAAIIPTNGKVFSPVDGKVEMVFGTKHAISMSTDTGIQILIHVGIDTVSLKGEPFQTFVETGQKVQRGELLMEADLAAIKRAGLDTVTPIVICNSEHYKEIITNEGKVVSAKDALITLIK